MAAPLPGQGEEHPEREERPKTWCRGKGVEFAGGISDHPWGRVATFRDPDGNDLQPYEPPQTT
ncbi:MAG: VOC family protein [Actinomycetota bacterium]|nr:VOC family protein [Actinomycetota bacterium]